MRNVRFIVFIVVLLSLLQEGRAQHFPVQATFYSKPPYPIKLSDYANPLGQNLSLKVILRDLNLGPTQVYFKFSITSNRASFSNRPQPGNVPMFTLTPGIVQTFTQADFGRYFTWENLGISPTVYSQPLGEDIYNFSVEILDVLTNKSLSGAVTLPPVWLVVNDPPILSLPANQGFVKTQNPQNTIFQWLPRHRQANAVEYDFVLTELLVPANYNGNLQNLFLSQPPYYQATTTNTTILFGPAMPPLIPGRTYGFRVRARAKMGFEDVGIFRNDGYSEIFIFTYGEKNRAPTITSAKWDWDGKAVVTWSGIDQQIRYDLQYAQQPTIQSTGYLSTILNSLTNPISILYGLQNPDLTKIGNNTYSSKLAIDNQKAYNFRVGGMTDLAADQTLYSDRVILQKFNWSSIAIAGVSRDNNDYLALLTGKSRKKNPTPLVATCQNPIVNPTDQTKNTIAIGDTLHVGGTDVRVITTEYAQAAIKTTGGGNTSIKLYFSENFQINQYNEVISGYLTSEPTGMQISLLAAGAGNSGDVADQSIRKLGIQIDSLKTVANKIYDDCKYNVQNRIGNILRVNYQMAGFKYKLVDKQTAITTCLNAINEKLSTETNAQKKQDLQKLRTQLQAQAVENQRNLTNLTAYLSKYLDFGTDAVSVLLPKLFML
ncbi:hypothetical protein GCM10028805_38750 [Spirosoma harenae]